MIIGKNCYLSFKEANLL
ncbi:MAG: hypothetical protein NC489_47210 [Ruminococcus flavefaciens]|nr:hypothetical protein [Ruminococcus flavefaciens]